MRVEIGVEQKPPLNDVPTAPTAQIASTAGGNGIGPMKPTNESHSPSGVLVGDLHRPAQGGGLSTIQPATEGESRLSRDEMLDFAEGLVRRGYQLVLLYGTSPDGACECPRGAGCQSPGKHPRERRWTERPIRTLDELASRWSLAHGAPNLGVMPDDGLIVIDVDRKNDKRGAETLAELEKQHGSLGAPDQITPSSGLHFVFRLPEGVQPASLPNRSGVAEGIDVLRSGRQFVAAPSQIGARRYQGSLPRREEMRVLPAPWLAYLQSLGGDATSDRASVDLAALSTRLEWLRGPSVAKVREVVKHIPNEAETTRQHYVWMAHAIKGAVGPEGDADGLGVFLDWAGGWNGPVDPVEDERVYTTISWQNVHSGWPDLWKLAEKHGYDAAAERTAEAQIVFAAEQLPYAVAPGVAAPSTAAPRSLHENLIELRDHLSSITDPLERDTARAEKLASIGHRFRIPFSILRIQFEAFDAPHRQRRPQIVRPGPALRDALASAPPQSLVPGYVFKEQQHVLYGAPQSYKTFVALDLALHAASGLPWLGRVPVRQVGVVFFAGEAAASLRVRIAAWFAARGLSVEDSERIPFALIDAVPTLGKGEDGLANAIGLVQEASANFGLPAGLLVLDNMTRMAGVAGLSTTDPGEYGRILAGIDSLGHEVGAATLTIYHSPVSDPKRPAGTYQSTANPDVVIKAERTSSAMTTLLQVAPPNGKSRNASPPPDLLLEFVEQDITGWLAASYDKAGRPYPVALADLTGGAFAAVDPKGSGRPGIQQQLVQSEASLSHEELRQQFTSLVVKRGERAKAGGTPASGLDAEAEMRRQVLETLKEHPGASQNTVRAAVGGKAARVDRAVLRLVEIGQVEDTGSPRTHRYNLTDSGRAQLQDALAQSEATIAQLEQTAAEPSRGGE